MSDDTLDALLAALIDAPGDAAQIAVMADRIEETGHPAQAWWRSTKPCPYGGLPLIGGGGAYGGASIRYAGEIEHPGVTDICQRLDRLHAARQAHLQESIP